MRAQRAPSLLLSPAKDGADDSTHGHDRRQSEACGEPSFDGFTALALVGRFEPDGVPRIAERFHNPVIGRGLS